MTKAQSRVEKTKQQKKQKKVKIVISDRTAKVLKMAWFPVTALVLFSIGLQVGVYLITRDPDAGTYQTIFDGDMWSSFFEALRNF